MAASQPQSFSEYRWEGEGALLAIGGMTGNQYNFYEKGVTLKVNDRDTNIISIPNLKKVE